MLGLSSILQDMVSLDTRRLTREWVSQLRGQSARTMKQLMYQSTVWKVCHSWVLIGIKHQVAQCLAATVGEPLLGYSLHIVLKALLPLRLIQENVDVNNESDCDKQEGQTGENTCRAKIMQD